MSISVSHQAVGIFLTALLVAGGGIAAYVDVKSDIAVVETKIDIAKDSKMELSNQVGDNSKSIIKTEARQESIEKTQNRLERTMDEILKEMKLMNDNLIRLEPKK